MLKGAGDGGGESEFTALVEKLRAELKLSLVPLSLSSLFPFSLSFVSSDLPPATSDATLLSRITRMCALYRCLTCPPPCRNRK